MKKKIVLKQGLFKFKFVFGFMENCFKENAARYLILLGCSGFRSAEYRNHEQGATDFNPILRKNAKWNSHHPRNREMEFATPGKKLRHPVIMSYVLQTQMGF